MDNWQHTPAARTLGGLLAALLATTVARAACPCLDGQAERSSRVRPIGLAALQGRPAASATLARAPVAFEPAPASRGSAPAYVARGEGFALKVGATSITAALRGTGRGAPDALVRVALHGARRSARATGASRLPGKVSYFIGGNPRAWRRGVPTYARVAARRVYPGIDVAYHGTQGQLEYDFVVSPGADPRQIALDVSGAVGLRVDRQGDLRIETAAGTLTHRKPVAYQDVNGMRRPVAASFDLVADRTVRFSVGAYDRSRTLVIDPVLVYATFLGGTGNDGANAVAVDRLGNVYMAGLTTSLDFPVSPPEARQPGKYGERQDAFIAKLNPSGTRVIYAAYLGGGNKDVANAIAVDADGNAYVAGRTESKYEAPYPQIEGDVANPGFPVTEGAYDTEGHASINNADAFISKISADGTSLMFSTYLGAGLDDEARAIAVDPQGYVYVAGTTKSVYDPTFPEQFQDFPTTQGALQTAYGGTGLLWGDGFITKMAPDGSSLAYSTYLGGQGEDYINAIALDPRGDLYVAGGTSSPNFPVTSGAYQTQYVGGGVYLAGDAFVAKVNPRGSGLLYSTYIGGGDADVANALAIDPAGNAYVAGFTYSSELDRPFPTTPTAFQSSKALDNCPRLWWEYGSNGEVIGTIEKPGLCEDGFLSLLNAGGTDLVYSTYYGGNSTDDTYALALDGQGNVYVAGRAGSTNLVVTASVPMLIGGGGKDGFLAKFGPDHQPVWLTQTSARVIGMAADGSGGVWIAGGTGAPAFPVTPDAVQSGYAGGITDVFLAHVTDGGGTPAPSGGPESKLYNVDATGIWMDLGGSQPELMILLRATPAVPDPPDVSPKVEVWGPDGSMLASGTLTFQKGVGFFDMVDTNVAAVQGDYQVRIIFPDDELTYVIILLDPPSLAAPKPRVSAPPDGSLLAQWDPVAGAKGYWGALVRANPDGTFALMASVPIGTGTQWQMPAGTLKQGQRYKLAIYALTQDPNAQPLGQGTFGVAGSSDEFGPVTPPPAASPGDLDGSGTVDVRDATLALRMAVGLATPTPAQKAAADINGDGKITVADVALILRNALGIG